MTAQHTPEPYRTSVAVAARADEKNDVAVLAQINGKECVIAEFFEHVGAGVYVSAHANAEYFVGAANCHEELLTATKKALRRMMTITNSYPTKHADKMVIAQLEKAIAKGTGAAS